jgi:hypothetical protein
MIAHSYGRNIYINCPFDEAYWPLMQAIIFCVFDCKYIPRSALESSDAGQTRIDKIYEIIEESRLSIHDISRTELSSTHQLPRFNMPLELGIFLGAKRYGEGRHQRKSCLVLDRDPYRYHVSVSDISGADIDSHGNEPERAIRAVRKWLNKDDRQVILSSPKKIIERYRLFQEELPRICTALDLDVSELDYVDYCYVVSEWLSEVSY